TVSQAIVCKPGVQARQRSSVRTLLAPLDGSIHPFKQAIGFLDREECRVVKETTAVADSLPLRLFSIDAAQGLGPRCSASSFHTPASQINTEVPLPDPLAFCPLIRPLHS